MWFAQVEGQFAIASITSDTTNFNHVIKHLDPQYSKEVKDIIVSPPDTHKTRRQKTFTILRHLQNLAGSCVCEDFLRTIWSSLLPSHIQTLLASQPHSPLKALADVADRMQGILLPGRQISSRSSGSIIENMTSEIAELKHAVKNLTAQLNRPCRSPT
ncbi:hypothetical protein EVAR_87530_1 [Eumeta japonica]|uniref:DUF7041 domain-containing protein n=1 Tax=Eumeta variegata TaxID=151549 RepID=A0A4C1XSN9_EUMVA|nr:hypothetical protein EVAR_87530_1 [Eumeta japonica]